MSKEYVYKCFENKFREIKELCVIFENDYALYLLIENAEIDSLKLNIKAEAYVYVTGDVNKSINWYNKQSARLIAKIHYEINFSDTPEGVPVVFSYFFTDVSFVSHNQLSQYDMFNAVERANNDTSAVGHACNIVDNADGRFIVYEAGMPVTDLDQINEQAKNILMNNMWTATHAPWYVMRSVKW